MRSTITLPTLLPLLSLPLVFLLSPILLTSNTYSALAQRVADSPLTTITHAESTPTNPTPRRQSSGGRPGWDPRWGIGPVIPPPGVLQGLEINSDNDNDPPGPSESNSGTGGGEGADPPSEYDGDEPSSNHNQDVGNQ
ncbi:hypothetical protein CVT25_006557 [Psilocybe cyanescens]|uniref:Uncharacterized protein n=1 Tax=Psilocybe cyanescens TaxID=93625 RepID=A0A409W274_PSICY|nr:hypothetical protein CVT25_006557 [Psilocybe cyanescens]